MFELSRSRLSRFSNGPQAATQRAFNGSLTALQRLSAPPPQVARFGSNGSFAFQVSDLREVLVLELHDEGSFQSGTVIASVQVLRCSV